MGLKKLQAGGGFLHANAWPAPRWPPRAASALMPRVTAALLAGTARSEGSFQPGLHHTRRVLEGTLGCCRYPRVLSHRLTCAVMVWGWVGS